jgi:hypothetical protein
LFDEQTQVVRAWARVLESLTGLRVSRSARSFRSGEKAKRSKSDDVLTVALLAIWQTFLGAKWLGHLW